MQLRGVVGFSCPSRPAYLGARPTWAGGPVLPQSCSTSPVLPIGLRPSQVPRVHCPGTWRVHHPWCKCLGSSQPSLRILLHLRNPSNRRNSTRSAPDKVAGPAESQASCAKLQACELIASLSRFTGGSAPATTDITTNIQRPKPHPSRRPRCNSSQPRRCCWQLGSSLRQ